MLLAMPAWAGQIWTVQAMNAGQGQVTCDAFASGMVGRPPYEFRFRRSKTNLLLIISYDGQLITGVRQATISVDGTPRGTLQAVATKFGERNAIAISLNPRSVDFAELEQHRSLLVSLGTQKFEIAPWAEDRIAANMAACEAKFLAH